MVIRKAEENDAEGIVKLFKKLDSETRFMMMEPGERQITIEKQASIIRSFYNSKSNLKAIADIEGHIAGLIIARAGTATRNCHSVYMIIGVEKKYWRTGLGSELIEFMENWAKMVGIHRIEFTVMEHNTAARALYKKFGYVEEGIKRDSLKVDGKYINEIYMSKII